MTNVDSSTLGGLTALKTLRMGENRLRQIVPGTWSSMPYLTTLDLHDNVITGPLTADVVAGLGRLQEFHVDGNEITDIYSYMYALQAHEPGDEVELIVERDGERITLTAKLGGR